MTLDDLGDPSYIALETYRRSGQGVTTPVWVVAEPGRLLVVTDRRTGKVKRIANDGRVAVCASDVRGRPRSAWVEAHARIVDEPAEVERTNGLLRTKYGLQYRLFTLAGRGRRGIGDTVLEITARA